MASMKMNNQLEDSAVVKKKMADEDSISKFLVTTGHEMEVRKLARTVLHQMLKCLSNAFEIHGFGKQCVKAAEDLTKRLYRWIEITHIECGFYDGDCYIIIYFRRMEGIHCAFRDAKIRVNERRKRRDLLYSMGLRAKGKYMVESIDTAETPSFVVDK